MWPWGAIAALKRENDALKVARVLLSEQVDDQRHRNNRLDKAVMELSRQIKNRLLIGDGFQMETNIWMQATFGPVISADKTERAHRFLEESLELVQAIGCTREAAHELVDYTFGRPVGEVDQGVGGAAVTLMALCNTFKITASDAAQVELDRCWANMAKIRAKQAAKPRFSALPQ